MSVFSIFIFFLIGYSTSALAQSPSPIVSRQTQHALDAERRLILNTELSAEYQELAKTKDFLSHTPTGELQAKAHRHEQNIRSLKRELDGIVGTGSPMSEPIRVVGRPERQPERIALRGADAAPTYWNPYNRTALTVQPTDSSTAPRRDTP